jgi:polyhydroxybutyrate depolymerase
MRLLVPLLALAALLAGVLTVGPLTPDAPRAADAAQTPAPACTPAAGDRRFGDALLHVPPHPKAPLPLVVAFHGSHGYGPWFPKESGLSKTADRYGFAVLYPTAGNSVRFWSLNRSMHPDDVALLRALLPQAEAAACVDKTRVYATGVSNGGGFTARVGCEMSDTFAAIAPVAGGYKALDPCPDGHRTSVLEIHGDADTVVPYHGRKGDGAGSVASFLGGWIRRDGCGDKPVFSRPERNVLRWTHTDCANGYVVEHLLLRGTDHGWPGAKPPYPAHNPSQLEANEEVWSFFADKRLH